MPVLSRCHPPVSHPPRSVSPSSPATVSPNTCIFAPCVVNPPLPFTVTSQGCDWGGDDTGAPPVRLCADLVCRPRRLLCRLWCADLGVDSVASQAVQGAPLQTTTLAATLGDLATTEHALCVYYARLALLLLLQQKPQVSI
eukprot:661966-Prorocentrum_minimum.AAC.3